MKRPAVLVINLFCILLTCGCDRQQPPPQAAVPTPVPQEAAEDSSADQIEMSDLLEALEIELWKGRFNVDPVKPVTRVVLAVKNPEQDANDVLSVDLTNDGNPVAGKLLVYVQQVEGQRLRIGLVWQDIDGRSQSSRNTIPSPFHAGTGVMSSSSHSIGTAGTMVLHRMTSGSASAEADAAAIILRSE